MHKSRAPKNIKPTDKDREQVKLLVKLGYTRDAICKLLDISPITLHKHFSPVIKEARTELAGKAVEVIEDIIEQAEDEKTRLRAAEIALNFFKYSQGGINNGMAGKVEVTVNVNESKIKKLQDELTGKTVELNVNDEGIYTDDDN